MKVSKEQVAQNREALIGAAARLFRERGIDGVGVAEICKLAGLTHGALYAQFPSKEALAAEALAEGVAGSNGRLAAPPDGHEPTLTEHLDHYLSSWHRDNMGGGCAMAASASEIARQPADVSVAFTDGFKELVDIIARALPNSGPTADRRQRALAITAAMIGGVAAARATAKANPALSDDILVAVRRLLAESAPTPRRKRR
jgi:TetR/AcrR family transcriptional regulator, transcriptional repressor for nem operon